LNLKIVGKRSVIVNARDKSLWEVGISWVNPKKSLINGKYASEQKGLKSGKSHLIKTKKYVGGKEKE